jgi:ketosteroid isomerase-like protein
MNDTIKRYFDAFNAGDVDGMLAFMAAPLAAAIAPFAG